MVDNPHPLGVSLVIGEAIGYALSHWDALIRPLDAGFLEVDNGAGERAMKPAALEVCPRIRG